METELEQTEQIIHYHITIKKRDQFRQEFRKKQLNEQFNKRRNQQKEPEVVSTLQKLINNPQEFIRALRILQQMKIEGDQELVKFLTEVQNECREKEIRKLCQDILQTIQRQGEHVENQKFQ